MDDRVGKGWERWLIYFNFHGNTSAIGFEYKIVNTFTLKEVEHD